MWRRVVSKGQLPKFEREYAVISTKLLSGRTVVRVCSTTAPGAGFEPAEPNLEDVYFSRLRGYVGSAGERTTLESAR